MAISGATIVSSNATLTYWDVSGDHLGNCYCNYGGTINYLTDISASASSVPSTGWSSKTATADHTILDAQPTKFNTTISVTAGTYSAAYYTNSQGSSASMVVWWRAAARKYKYVLTWYDESYDKEDIGVVMCNFNRTSFTRSNTNDLLMDLITNETGDTIEYSTPPMVYNSFFTLVESISNIYLYGYNSINNSITTKTYYKVGIMEYQLTIVSSDLD